MPLQALDNTIVHSKQGVIMKILESQAIHNHMSFFTRYVSEEQITNAELDKILLYQFDSRYTDKTLRKYDKILQTQGKHLYILTEVFTDLPAYKNITIEFYPELLSVYTHYTTPNVPGRIKKLFNCFIQRVDSVRQSWFYFLHLNKLLDRGYVSFRLFQYDFYSQLEGVELYNYIHQQHQLGKVEKFQQAFDELKDKVPFCNFHEDGDLLEKVLTSKYSVVLDTYATVDNQYQWIPGEKVFRALLTPTVPLLFQQQGMSTKLESVGFKSVGPDIDNLDWLAKQQAILEILNNDSIQVPDAIIKDVLVNNKDVSINLQKQLEQNCYFEDFFDKIK